MSYDPEVDKLAEIFDTHKMDYPGIRPSDGELFDKVCEIARSRRKPKLPRVQPDDLIPGKVYLAKRAISDWIEFVFYNGEFSVGPCVYRFEYSQPAILEEYSRFWGPIPEFELEGEA